MEHAKLGSVISFNKTLRLNRTLRGPAESIKIWLGRTLSITTHHVKITSQKIVNVFIRVFKNLPQSLKSGYGMGFIGVLISGTLLTTAVCLNPKTYGNKSRSHYCFNCIFMYCLRSCMHF
ncbi:MAG: hypothetical protein HWD61_10470 [Parachlamydiaceae bacterium]|nr:MAG: hypothetical protein HWD61_10470 [Parachlamydiaceae bacterium]